MYSHSRSPPAVPGLSPSDRFVLIGAPGLPPGASLQVPVDCRSESGFQRRPGREAERLPCAMRIQLPSRLAVRPRGVPVDLPREANQAPDQIRHLADADLQARAQVHGITAV